MAVIGIFTEPTGRTRVMFDFCAARGRNDMARIEQAMAHARPAVSHPPEEPPAASGKVRPPRRAIPAYQ